MTQKPFPIWFRAYVFVPVLGVLYAVIPLAVWNFSPDALTHTVPVFLLGATDWGTGNIYTFTKIAYWIGLVAGAIANAPIVAEAHGFAGSFLWRCRLNAWHMGAAFVIVLFALPGGLNTDSIDMWLLFGYFFLGATSILLLLALAKQKGWPRFRCFLLTLAPAVAWGFVPVSFGRP